MKRLILFMILIASSSIIYCQKTGQDDYNKIYDNIRSDLNPRVPNPAKWITTDTKIILKVFRQLKRNFLPRDKNGRYDDSKAQEFENTILEEKAYMQCVMGESEIDTIFFYSDKDTMDTISDWNQLQFVLGKNDYELLKQKNYDHLDISNPLDYDKELDEYDITLNWLRPKIHLFSHKSMWTASFVGQWGENLTVNPGWFSPDYFLGIEISEFNKLSLRRTYHRPKWSITAGIVISKSSLMSGNLPSKPLKNAGEGLYFKITGKPFQSNNSFKNAELLFSGKFNLSNFNWQHYGIFEPTDFYANKTYLTLQLKNNHENISIIDLGELNYGGGLVFYDIHHFFLNPNTQTVTDLEKDKAQFKKFNMSIVGEVGIENSSNVFQHEFKLLLNWEPAKKFAYLGIMFNFLISDTFGFDLVYYKAIKGFNSLPSWRTDEYFVFSPTFRISY